MSELLSSFSILHHASLDPVSQAAHNLYSGITPFFLHLENPLVAHGEVQSDVQKNRKPAAQSFEGNKYLQDAANNTTRPTKLRNPAARAQKMNGSPQMIGQKRKSASEGDASDDEKRPGQRQ